MSTLTSADRALHEFAALVGADDPIAVEGNRTRWHLGGPLDESARLVTAPTGIVDYQPSEMVVTVRAGTTVAELHETLAAAGQTSALPDRGGTVGGAVAVGENRLDRLGRGSARDAVLQVRYVSAEGEIVTGGGPVVKNVSGFNLPKLIVGSLGTLGLIAEVVLRTNPLPPVQRWIRAERVDLATSGMHFCDLEPCCGMAPAAGRSSRGTRWMSTLRSTSLRRSPTSPMSTARPSCHRTVGFSPLRGQRTSTR